MSSSSTKTHINKTKQTHPPQTESINISIITAISHVVLSKISSTPSTHQRNQRVFSRFLRVYLVFSHGFLMCFIPFWLGVSFHISIFSIFPMVFTWFSPSSRPPHPPVFSGRLLSSAGAATSRGRWCKICWPPAPR